MCGAPLRFPASSPGNVCILYFCFTNAACCWCIYDLYSLYILAFCICAPFSAALKSNPFNVSPPKNWQSFTTCSLGTSASIKALGAASPLCMIIPLNLIAPDGVMVFSIWAFIPKDPTKNPKNSSSFNNFIKFYLYTNIDNY